MYFTCIIGYLMVMLYLILVVEQDVSSTYKLNSVYIHLFLNKLEITSAC